MEKTRRGHDKHCPEARNYDGATKNKRAREGPSRTREGHRREEPSLGPPASETDARPPKLRRGRGQEALTRKSACSARAKSLPELGLEQQNRCRNTRSAKRAPGRNRARDHPLQRRTRDHRATSPAAGPRRAHGSAAAKRARPRKRASLVRGKICDFGPELGFEQRNRFRSLQDTRRTEKKVLRKPPAGGANI